MPAQTNNKSNCTFTMEGLTTTVEGKFYKKAKVKTDEEYLQENSIEDPDKRKQSSQTLAGSNTRHPQARTPL